jgi:hypothetical protein
MISRMTSLSRAERNTFGRNHEQNAKFHAMCRDIANQCTWAGSRWSEEDWKRIFLGAKFGQPIVPSPFGHGVVVVNAKRSRDLSREDMAELIAEVEVFGIENEVTWSEHEPE